jgi:hypothetical protein
MGNIQKNPEERPNGALLVFGAGTLISTHLSTGRDTNDPHPSQ